MINRSFPLKVSIVIPAYNAAKWLTETLDSVLQQDYQQLEIIVVNDGSTDNTESLVEKYLSDHRVRYIYQQNSGLPGARNAGIQAATGDAIMFVDADDVLLESTISTLARELQSLDEEYCAVHGEMERFDGSTGKPLGITNYKQASSSRRSLLNTRANLLLTCLIRKSAIAQSGLFHQDMQSASEDIDFIFRLSKFGRFKAIDRVVYKYRIHSQSKTHNFTYDHASSVVNEHRLMLQRVLKGENLLLKIEAWATHYFWAGVDFHRYDKHLARKLWLIALFLNPFHIEPLKLLRASYLNKI